MPFKRPLGERAENQTPPNFIRVRYINFFYCIIFANSCHSSVLKKSNFYKMNKWKGFSHCKTSALLSVKMSFSNVNWKVIRSLWSSGSRMDKMSPNVPIIKYLLSHIPFWISLSKLSAFKKMVIVFELIENSYHWRSRLFLKSNGAEKFRKQWNFD